MCIKAQLNLQMGLSELYLSNQWEVSHSCMYEEEKALFKEG